MYAFHVMAGNREPAFRMADICARATSAPMWITVQSSGVKPSYQASRQSLVLPVLPAACSPLMRALEVFSYTPLSIVCTIQAVEAGTTWVAAKLCASIVVPFCVSMRRIGSVSYTHLRAHETR